jgi:hypothetical protein
MNRPDIYRRRAEDCLLTAAICTSPERKEFLTTMAKAWRRLAQPQHIQDAVGQANAQREEEAAPASRG